MLLNKFIMWPAFSPNDREREEQAARFQWIVILD